MRPRLLVSWLSVLAFVVSRKDQGLSENQIKNELNETLFFVWGNPEFENPPYDDGDCNFSWMVDVRGYEFASRVFDIACAVLRSAKEEDRLCFSKEAMLSDLNCFLLSQSHAPILFEDAPEQFGLVWAQVLQMQFNSPVLSLHVAKAS